MDYDSGQGSSITIMSWNDEERLNKMIYQLINVSKSNEIIAICAIILDLVETLRK